MEAVRRAAVVVVLALVAIPSLARAGVWYYGWRCSGQCTPNQLAITGVWMWASLGNTGDPVAPTMAEVNAPSLVGELSLTWRNSVIPW